MNAPYAPKRKQSEIEETIADDWERVFPNGEVLDVGDARFRATMHDNDEPATYWLVEASDALRMWPDDHGANRDNHDEIGRQLSALGAIAYDH